MGLEARLEKSTAKALYQILDGIALFGLSYEVMAINYLATKEMIEVIPDHPQIATLVTISLGYNNLRILKKGMDSILGFDILEEG